MMSTPTCIIADDEPLHLPRIKRWVTKFWPEVRIVGEANNVDDIVTLMEEKQPDVAFLDVRMPGPLEWDAAANGDYTTIELAKSCKHLPTAIIFLTQDADRWGKLYASQGWKSNAIAFLEKAAPDDDFKEVVEKAKASLSEPKLDVAAVLQSLTRKRYLERIPASTAMLTRFIPVDDIIYIHSDCKYQKVKTREHESFIRTPIKELAVQLDPEKFWQVHRSTIVNLRFLEGVQKDGDGGMTVVMKDCKERLEVSKQFQSRFRQM